MIVLNELQLNGWYLLTHDLSHESWFQLDMKVHGTSYTKLVEGGIS